MSSCIGIFLVQSDQFQPDLYPDTASPTPAMSAEEWFAGTTRGPVLMSMKTGEATGERCHSTQATQALFKGRHSALFFYNAHIENCLQE